MVGWMVRVGSGVVAMAALVALRAPTAALAATPGEPAAGSSGHDISWPQCDSALPTDGAYGIVGVTDGRAWSANPCLASEFNAAAATMAPGLYMNTANPAPSSGYYWPASGTSDPALCRDAASTTDPGCAYDYGWHSAANAMATVAATLGDAAVGYWWLDVETGNTWNGDASSNAADLQGSIDYLMSRDVAGVGVYSTAKQWAAITGGYTASTEARYATAWSGEFSSPNGIAHSPSWVAGASGPADAPDHCAGSFLGTTTWFVQYVAGGLDVDYACGAVIAGGDYAISVPATASASSGASVTVPVTMTSTGGWTGTLALTVIAPSRVSATLSSPSVGLSAGDTDTATATLHSTRTGGYTVTVTAEPVAGSSTSARHSASTAFTVGNGGHRLTS